MPIARPYYEEDYADDEEEKATLARFVPLDSEIRSLLDDPEETLAYIRRVQASVPDPDSALDSLVAVYEDRVERLARERVRAQEIAAQEKIVAERALETARARRAQSAPTPASLAMAKLQPHFWKIVYSAICVWGLLQLAFTR